MKSDRPERNSYRRPKRQTESPKPAPKPPPKQVRIVCPPLDPLPLSWESLYRQVSSEASEVKDSEIEQFLEKFDHPILLSQARKEEQERKELVEKLRLRKKQYWKYADTKLFCRIEKKIPKEEILKLDSLRRKRSESSFLLDDEKEPDPLDFESHNSNHPSKTLLKGVEKSKKPVDPKEEPKQPFQRKKCVAKTKMLVNTASINVPHFLKRRTSMLSNIELQMDSSSRKHIDRNENSFSLKKPPSIDSMLPGDGSTVRQSKLESPYKEESKEDYQQFPRQSSNESLCKLSLKARSVQIVKRPSKQLKDTQEKTKTLQIEEIKEEKRAGNCWKVK